MSAPVSFKHLTLPTKRVVEILVGAVSLKKKKKRSEAGRGGMREIGVATARMGRVKAGAEDKRV